MLPDLIGPAPRMIFCGTAAGRASAAQGHYYAGPGNRFWPMLAETGLTPRRLRPDEDATLPALGLGLTDLAKGVAGMDREIPAGAYAPARLDAIVARHRPAALAFTSLAAGRLALGDRRVTAGRQPEQARWPGVALFVLPSPSGAARGHFRAAPWQEAAAFVRAQDRGEVS
jgi:TDG/mug DNA glycosylase family protein